MNIKQQFTKIKNLLKRFWAWVRIRPRNAIISAIVFLLVVVGLILFIQFVLPILLLAAIIAWGFFGDGIRGLFTPTLTLDDDEVAWEVSNFMFSSVSSVHDVLTEYVSTPMTVNDLYDGADYRSIYNSAPILKMRLLRKQKDVSDDDAAYIKNAVQSAINSRILDGHLIGYDWAVKAAADIPLVKVAAVTVSAAYIHIDVLLVNTAASVRAARKSDKPTPSPSADSSDPLFRKGDK